MVVDTGIGPGVQTRPDPFQLSKSWRFGDLNRFNEYQTRTPVSAVSVPAGELTKCILIIGDSVPSNTVPTPYAVVQARHHTLNICNGGLYRAGDSMLGSGRDPIGGGVGSFATPMGEFLISGGWCQRVIMGNPSYGSALVSDWAPGTPPGVFNNDLAVSCLRFAALRLTISAVIWLAGPNDDAAGTSQASYTASLLGVIATVRIYVPAPVPILICFYANHITPNVAIRAAQASVINHATGIWEGVDVDAYANDKFQAGVGHLSDLGSTTLATDMITKLHVANVI